MSDLSNTVSLLLHFPAHLKDLYFYILFAIECTCLLPRDEPLGPIWFLPPGRGLRPLHCTSLHSYIRGDPQSLMAGRWVISTPSVYAGQEEQHDEQANKYPGESGDFVARSHT